MSSAKNLIAGRYEVISHIGQGGMADVFLALDSILNRQVAIKILRADLSQDTVSILRFEREAQAATALSHPNIVEIYDVGDYKGHHYIVMEYVPGKTLKQIIRERGPLMKEEAIDIMKQLTSAIFEAHKKGIIHRDIKPQNIIVKSDGTIKILDFGIATAKGSSQLTQANNVMGSVHYLAPELAKGDGASSQSDVYAMGIVLFEMLAGDVPYKADQAVQIALMHMRDPLPDIRILNPSIPQSIANIIDKAAAKAVQDRYQTAGEMLKDLETCLNPERLNEPAAIHKGYDTHALQQAERFARERIQHDDDNFEDSLEFTFERKERKRKEKQARKKQGKRRPLYIWITVAIIALLALILTAYQAGLLNGLFLTTVPDISDKTVSEASALLEESHLRLDTENITYRLTSNIEADHIVSCDPKIGKSVERNSVVKVVVSQGIGDEMQDYTGYDLDAAIESLQKYEKLAIETEEDTTSDEPPGTITKQSGIAKGELFDPNVVNSIVFTYVPYPSAMIPEDIIGKDYNTAAKELESLGLTVFASQIDSATLSDDELRKIRDENLAGTVSYTEPSVGTQYTQKAHSHITLYYYSYIDKANNPTPTPTPTSDMEKKHAS